MAERTADVQAHWTRPGVLVRIDAALTELGHDPQKLTPEILAAVEHLHSGGLATTREQAKRIALTEDSRGVLTERSKLFDRVVLQIGNAPDLPYPDQTFDVVWCQNVAMNIADKDGLFAGVYRALKPGGLFTSTEYSVRPGGDIIFPVPWAYDASINFLDPEDVMRERYHTAGFRVLERMNYSNTVIEHYERMLSAPPKLTSRLIFGDDAPERQRNSQRNLIERRTIYWMITAERPKPRFS